MGGERRGWLRGCCARPRSALAMPALAPDRAAAAPPPDPAELDPSAPLDPMPDLGVDWPDLETDADRPPATRAAPAERRRAGRQRTSRRTQAPNCITASPSRAWRPIGRRDELLDGVPPAVGAAQGPQGRGQCRPDRPPLARRRRAARPSCCAARAIMMPMVEPRIERGREHRCGSCSQRRARRRNTASQSVELPGLEAAGAEAPKLREAFAVKAGDPVIAEDVIAAERRAHGRARRAGVRAGQGRRAGHRGRPRDAHRASWCCRSSPARSRAFGDDPGQRQAAVQRRAMSATDRPLQAPATRSERSKVDDLRRALIATGLVASAEIQVGPGRRRADRRPRRAASSRRRCTPSPASSATAPARACALEASWQHRNFFNPEGALTLRGVAGTQRAARRASSSAAAISCSATRCSTCRRSASHTRPFDAYEAKTIQLAGNIERQSNFIWQKKWTWSLGAELLATDERGVFDSPGVKDTRTFLIAALPASLGYDGSDDCSTRPAGFRLGGRVSPEISAHGGSFAYARTQFDASAYQPVSRPHRRRRARPARARSSAPVRCRHRAVAALLFGRRRIGARLRLSAARAAGHRRRSDRRPRPGRIRARGAHPAEGVRRQFRHRAVLRRRHR